MTHTPRIKLESRQWRHPLWPLRPDEKRKSYSTVPFEGFARGAIGSRVGLRPLFLSRSGTRDAIAFLGSTGSARLLVEKWLWLARRQRSSLVLSRSCFTPAGAQLFEEGRLDQNGVILMVHALSSQLMGISFFWHREKLNANWQQQTGQLRGVVAISIPTWNSTRSPRELASSSSVMVRDTRRRNLYSIRMRPCSDWGEREAPQEFPGLVLWA